MTDGLELKPILDGDKSKLGEKLRNQVKDAFTLDWYFHGWEKLLIVACFVWGVYSFGKFIWSLLW